MPHARAGEPRREATPFSVAPAQDARMDEAVPVDPVEQGIVDLLRTRIMVVCRGRGRTQERERSVIGDFEGLPQRGWLEVGRAGLVLGGGEWEGLWRRDVRGGG